MRVRTSSQSKISISNPNKQVNLHKLKKSALVKKCRSLLSFPTFDDIDDISFPNKTNCIRRSSFPSYDNDAWRNNRIDRSII
jgi:hypothetical protein